MSDCLISLSSTSTNAISALAPKQDRKTKAESTSEGSRSNDFAMKAATCSGIFISRILSVSQSHRRREREGYSNCCLCKSIINCFTKRGLPFVLWCRMSARGRVMRGSKDNTVDTISFKASLLRGERWILVVSTPKPLIEERTRLRGCVEPNSSSRQLMKMNRRWYL